MSNAWLIKLAASFFFLGYAPVASGTVGALGAVPLYWIMPKALWLYAAVTAVLFFLGVWVCTRAEQVFGKKDSSRIVIDEVVGFLVTMAGISSRSWLVIAIGFLLSRFFDIWRPYPVNKLESCPHGWGVMLDDVAAGVYANLALRAIMKIL